MDDYFNPDHLDINLIEGELKRNNISYNLGNYTLNEYIDGLSANLLLGNNEEIKETDLDFKKDYTTPQIEQEIVRVLNELRKIYSEE